MIIYYYILLLLNLIPYNVQIIIIFMSENAFIVSNIIS